MIETITSFILAGALALSAVVIAVVGRRMKNGEVPPNSLVGVRTKRACLSQESWYTAQASCAPYVVLLAIMLLDSAVLLAIQGIFSDVIPLEVPGAIMIVQLIIGIVLIYRAASVGNSQS